MGASEKKKPEFRVTVHTPSEPFTALAASLGTTMPVELVSSVAQATIARLNALAQQPQGDAEALGIGATADGSRCYTARAQLALWRGALCRRRH